MSGNQTRTRERAPQMQNPFGMGGEVAPLDTEAAALPTLMPAGGAGRATDNALAGVITAQRVAIKRDLGGILAEAKALGASAGQDFFYSIPYKSKDKDTGEFKTVYVEGPSIKAAMACASLYGNCRVGANVQRETHSHWFFTAIFQDLEKGVTVMREFQAQKPQEGRGRMDTARRADMDFQSAQSKAIRNVVVAAIPLVVDAAYQAAHGSMLNRVKSNPDAARDHALDLLDRIRVNLARVERTMATPAEKWTPQQIVRVIMDARAVGDGMTSADETWPPAPSDAQTAQEHADTVVQEAAAADGPQDGAENDGSAEDGTASSAGGAEGSGSAAGEEGAQGASAPADDPAERRDDPPPPAAEKTAEPPQQAKAQPPKPAPKKPDAPKGGGLNFD